MKVHCTLPVIVLCASMCAGDLGRAAEGQEQPAPRKNAVPVEAQAGVLNICEVLQKIDSLNGSIVAVRGYYRFGMELGGLYGRNCPKKLVLDGTQRAQAFHLEYGPRFRCEVLKELTQASTSRFSVNRG